MVEFLWGVFIGIFICAAGTVVVLAWTAFKNIRGISS